METCVILNGRLALTAETAERARIQRPADARVSVEGDALVLEPAGEHRAGEANAFQAGQLTLPLAAETLTALGWQAGDVLGIELVDGRVEVRRLAHPDDPALTELDEDGIPLPPQWLAQMVAGTTARSIFVDRGHRVAKLFAGIIERRLPSVASPAILDFGCGCGRVARLMPLYLRCAIAGCDITTQAIEWCRRNLTGDFFLSADEPPVDVPDERYDVLYAVSVLTHLDEQRQDGWLAEWRRIVRPGGLLLVTFRGDGFVARGDPSRREEVARMLEPTGFAFTSTDYWEGLFPEYYGGAFHTNAYVEEHWGGFFDVLELHPPRETGLVQDLAVLRRRRDPQAPGT
jgi:SAM-dependent methyltransferase